jgi:hypothetical protein
MVGVPAASVLSQAEIDFRMTGALALFDKSPSWGVHCATKAAQIVHTYGIEGLNQIPVQEQVMMLAGLQWFKIHQQRQTDAQAAAALAAGLASPAPAPPANAAVAPPPVSAPSAIAAAVQQPPSAAAAVLPGAAGKEASPAAATPQDPRHVVPDAALVQVLNRTAPLVSEWAVYVSTCLKHNGFMAPEVAAYCTLLHERITASAKLTAALSDAGTKGLFSAQPKELMRQLLRYEEVPERLQALLWPDEYCRRRAADEAAGASGAVAGPPAPAAPAAAGGPQASSSSSATAAAHDAMPRSAVQGADVAASATPT